MYEPRNPLVKESMLFTRVATPVSVMVGSFLLMTSIYSDVLSSLAQLMTGTLGSILLIFGVLCGIETLLVEHRNRKLEIDMALKSGYPYARRESKATPGE